MPRLPLRACGEGAPIESDQLQSVNSESQIVKGAGVSAFHRLCRLICGKASPYRQLDYFFHFFDREASLAIEEERWGKRIGKA